MTAPFVEPLKQVCEHLDRLGIAYFVGGSMASTMHGEIRTTQDVDLVVELRRDQVGELARSLEAEFFADVEALMFAVENHSSCNIIHRTTAFKVDLFLRRDRPFSECEMARRVYVAIGGLRLPMATAEDCVLTKLEWFEKGGRVSDRQWRDVLGVIKNCSNGLDVGYLRRWAPELGVLDALERALVEAGES